jgi:hypothetical protein
LRVKINVFLLPFSIGNILGREGGIAIWCNTLSSILFFNKTPSVGW